MQYKFILVPLATWFGVQLFKTLYEFAKTKKLDYSRLLASGGIVSSHSAVTTSITTMIGKECGFNSPIFALALIFSFVVMYDAAGIRRAAGNQAIVLNKIVNKTEFSELLSTEEKQKKLDEVLGHKPIQVFFGAIVGIVVGIIA